MCSESFRFEISGNFRNSKKGNVANPVARGFADYLHIEKNHFPGIDIFR